MSEQNAPRFAVATGRRVADVSSPLLEYLRSAVGDSSLDYVTNPTAILGGFDTLIYRFHLAAAAPPYDAPLILRLFRTAEDADRAGYEAAVQNSVAALGYPAPRVLVVETNPQHLGAPFTIMQRMPGRVMLEALLGPRMFAMPALLARAHARLHALDVTEFRRLLGDARDPRRLDSVDAVLDRYEQGVAMWRLDGMQNALKWVREQRPAIAEESICHGDFHPLNILIEGKDVTGVVDWGWCAIADPAYDVGATAALMTQGPIDMPRIVKPIVDVIRRSLVRRYVRAYTAERPLDLGRVRYYEAMRLTGFLLEAGEQLRRGPTEDGAQSAFSARDVHEGIHKRLRAITGIESQLPSN